MNLCSDAPSTTRYVWQRVFGSKPNRVVLTVTAIPEAFRSGPQLTVAFDTEASRPPRGMPACCGELGVECAFCEEDAIQVGRQQIPIMTCSCNDCTDLREEGGYLTFSIAELRFLSLCIARFRRILRNGGL